MDLLTQAAQTIENPLNIIGGGDRDLTGGGGLINFISNVVKLVTVAGGLFAFFNLLLAGFTYVSSQGNPKSIEAAKSQITMSVLGLLLMVGSVVITAIVSQIFFGSPTAILQPQIYGPGNE